MRSIIKPILLCLPILVANLASSVNAEELPLWKRPKFEQLKVAETKLREAEVRVKNDPAEDPLTYLNSPLPSLGVLRTFVGDALGGLESFDRFSVLANRIDRIEEGDLARLQSSVAVDAIDAIVAEARLRQIVILNEAHHVPLHRAFAMRLARELRKIGYEYLACETFGENFDQGYLRQSTGYYSREPMYANFLRDAQKDGWKFVQYEPMNLDRALSTDQMEIQRESGQAANIVVSTFRLNPKAKVFIYVGFGHGMKKRTDPTQFTFMAEYLRDLTHLDPLSIDQTSLYNHSAPQFNHPLYAGVIQKHNQQSQQRAFVLRSANSGYEVFARYRGRVDMQVIHPRYEIDANTRRFEWLATLSELSPREIPAHLLPQAGRRVVYAYHIDETKGAVPYDAVLVEVGKPIPKLMLPRAEFRFEFED